jgi:hypothetical protein
LPCGIPAQFWDKIACIPAGVLREAQDARLVTTGMSQAGKKGAQIFTLSPLAGQRRLSSLYGIKLRKSQKTLGAQGIEACPNKRMRSVLWDTMQQGKRPYKTLGVHKGQWPKSFWRSQKIGAGWSFASLTARPCSLESPVCGVLRRKCAQIPNYKEILNRLLLFSLLPIPYPK